MAKPHKRQTAPLPPVAEELKEVAPSGLMEPWRDLAPANSLVASYQAGRSVNRLHFHMQAISLLTRDKDAITDEISDGLIVFSPLIPSDIARGNTIAHDIREAHECWLGRTLTQEDFGEMLEESYDEVHYADLPLHKIRARWTARSNVDLCIRYIKEAFTREMSDQQKECFSLGFCFDTGLYPKDLCGCVDRPADVDLPGQTVGWPFDRNRGVTWYPLGNYLPAIAEVQPQPEWHNQVTRCLNDAGVSVDLTPRLLEFVRADHIERQRIAADVDEIIRAHLAKLGDQTSSLDLEYPSEDRQQTQAADTEADHTNTEFPKAAHAMGESPNEERDAWIYEQCCGSATYSQIIQQLGEQTSWSCIGSTNGIKSAAERYAKRYNLSMPPPRKSGRPPNKTKASGS